MHRLGVPRHRLRIAPPTLSVNGAEKLQLAARAWPQWFNRVAERLPGARSVARYGKAAITATRRLGESWEQTYQRECIEEAPQWISERAQKVKERHHPASRWALRHATPRDIAVSPLHRGQRQLAKVDSESCI